jgi:hypothetical protein
VARCCAAGELSLMTQPQWISVATYASALEADIAVARLESAGILAVARGNDIVGLFGPGFGGNTARGVEVLVPSDEIDTARELLNEADA